ncbi:hypothetical protein CTRI78_v003580 [Colletotrichum trifolii]|uniref:Lysine-specific metallo-endopeptidase domain-containing protein n=1 Tax=Colletotrichum trifolii TaxID=5466 RepID=A0A4R8RJB4_COLTR|nr:hypothetical protein CTRI78_v003580 [Colletotrichum trifolii]
MQCLIPFLLLLPPLVFSHSTLSEPRSLRKRADKTNIGIIAGAKGRSEGSDFFCDSYQTAIIEKAIGWMHAYAASGYNFLLEPDSETTAAFIGWFGFDEETRIQDSNTDDAVDMRRNIYDPIYELGSEARYYVSALEDIDETVVIGCATETNYPLCQTGALALAHQLYNTIVVCPISFSNGGYHATDEAEFSAQRTWREYRQHVPTAGQVLLHEMTHLKGVVGDFGHWQQYASTDHAYEPSKCIRLPDDETRNNAQNYMLFAMEVRANEQYAKKQVDLEADNKWSDAVERLRVGAGGRHETP